MSEYLGDLRGLDDEPFCSTAKRLAALKLEDPMQDTLQRPAIARADAEAKDRLARRSGADLARDPGYHIVRTAAELQAVRCTSISVGVD